MDFFKKFSCFFNSVYPNYGHNFLFLHSLVNRSSNVSEGLTVSFFTEAELVQVDD